MDILDENETKMLYNFMKTYPLGEDPGTAAPVAVVVAILITGERIPAILLKLLASASPVPRWGAGKT